MHMRVCTVCHGLMNEVVYNLNSFVTQMKLSRQCLILCRWLATSSGRHTFRTMCPQYMLYEFTIPDHCLHYLFIRRSCRICDYNSVMIRPVTSTLYPRLHIAQCGQVIELIAHKKLARACLHCVPRVDE